MRLQKNICTCLDVNSRTCGIYALRPRVCRTLEVGSDECRLVRLWADSELGWFGENPQLPEPGSFKRFCMGSQAETIADLINDLT